MRVGIFLKEFVAKLKHPIINIILVRILYVQTFDVVKIFTIIIRFKDIFIDVRFQKYIAKNKFENIREK